MAGQRLTDKTALAEQLAKDDLLMVVDISDTTGSAEGTSKKIEAQYIITTDMVTLSNADVLALDTTPITLVLLKTGYMVTPISVTVLCAYAAATELARKDLLFGFDESSDTQFWGKVDAAMDTLTADATYVVQGQDAPRAPSCDGSIEDKAFKVWSEGTGFAGGWSCDIYVTYAYTKII
tara:strand:- start:324 stop:860 length:537 start_codon:yes stop_codon:yes gene_type:complete